jgi:branched-chain amino acid aminotransferase
MSNFRNAFFKGKIVPYEQATLNLATHAFLYGTAVFGGVRAYWNADRKKLFIFRPYDHYRRLLNSAKTMCMESQYDIETLIQITIDLLKADGWAQDVYLRPTFYKATEGIGVRLHDLEDAFSIFTMPFDKYIKNDTNAHVTISSWRRLDDNMIPARGKVSGAYANSALIKTDAARAGFDEALVLTQDGHISEGSAMNIFVVRDGALITPPVTENILEGITRKSVIELAKNELNLNVIERPIDRTEVYLADELFLTGTAAQITVATKVDHRPIGTGAMGPIAAKLRELFDDIVRAKNPTYTKWNVEVK